MVLDGGHEVMTSPLAGLSGGSNYSNSDSKEQKDKKKTEKRKYLTFKYSSRLRGALHEAVILDGKPAFLRFSEKTGKIEKVMQIEEDNRILRPPNIEEYPYEPIEFTSMEEVREYESIKLDKNELYQKIKGTVSFYVVQDTDIIILISADILWTYFQDLFPTTHYYDIFGKGNGIGKSTIGYVFEGIAYRGVRMTDPSSANLYRILGKIEPGQCILITDEADRMDKDRQMLSILKEGYAILGKVSKINRNTDEQEFFFSYCFKIRIAEDPLSFNAAKGLVNRLFTLRVHKGRPTYDIKEVLHPAARNPRLDKLHNDLRDLRKQLFIYRLKHFRDGIADIDVGLEGRDKELSKPLLQLFHGTKCYDEIAHALARFRDKKNKRKRNASFDRLLYSIVVTAVNEYGTEILASDMWDLIRSNMKGFYDEEKKPNEFQPYDYDIIYRGPTSKFICESFGAESRHRRDGNVLVFDVDELVKAGKSYDFDASIQARIDSILKKQEEAEEERACEGVKAVRATITDMHTAATSIIEKIEENGEDNDKISKEMVVNQQSLSNINGQQSSHAHMLPSQASRVHDPNPKVNTYRIGDTDTFGCKDCRLRGDKWFMQDHDCNGNGNSKNKCSRRHGSH